MFALSKSATFFNHARSFSSSRVHSRFVKVSDVTPRDGLQSLPYSIPFVVKKNLIESLAGANIHAIEIGSIVKLPTMADTPRLIEELEKPKKVKHLVLVPNLKGLKIALMKGAREISFPLAVSETFLKKNINCSIKEALDQLSQVLQELKKVENTHLRVYLSCCPSCPDEGVIPVDKIAALAERLFKMNCDEIFPSDTLGQATPSQIRQMLLAIQEKGVPMDRIGLHLHGNGEQVLANVEEALRLGVRLFDSSIGNLGGCPVLKKEVKGNIPTDQLVEFLHNKGYETGIDTNMLFEINTGLIKVLEIASRKPYFIYQSES